MQSKALTKDSAFGGLLLPGWEPIVTRGEKEAKAVPEAIHLPKSVEYFSSQITYVTSAVDAKAMVELARERRLSHIGIDTEFRYSRPAVRIDPRHDATDPRSIQPLLLSLAMVEPVPAGTMVFRFVVDLRCPEVLPYLTDLLAGAVPFVAHYGTVELFCLWQLGLVEPRTIWDTFLAEKALHLGLHAAPRQADESADIEARAQEEQDEQIRYDLVTSCRRHGVAYLLATDKTRLQKSFLTHVDGTPFSPEQIEYAAEDAAAAAQLYFPQVNAAARAGLLNHLVQIEMPFMCVNARVTWNGVRIDAVARDQLPHACDIKLTKITAALTEMGLDNFSSHKQLKDFFERRGLLECFRNGLKYCFDKDRLKEYRGRDPAIDLIYEARRLRSLRADKILWPQLVGVDGRVHADHRQLGATSGRQTCSRPNLLGLGRGLRPLIIPEDGYGIGEVDLSQIEVGVAAAYYGDARLVEMFNTGDVYSSMAQICFADTLSESDRALSPKAFKAKHKGQRDEMKTCTLGIIYGLTAFGLALKLSKTKAEAAALLEKFMSMFPDLARALKEVVDFGLTAGFATTVTGLRRYRAGTGRPTNWERNWLRNHPIQGSAADVFKAACIRLNRLYQRHHAKMILLVHDAVVFECPKDAVLTVGQLTERVLCETVNEFFPVLNARAEINIDHPECWNKDGNATALSSWLSEALEAGERAQ